MSYSYDKYRGMSDEQLQKAIDERQVTVAYLGWLGIVGKGKMLRDISAEVSAEVKEHKQSVASQEPRGVSLPYGNLPDATPRR